MSIWWVVVALWVGASAGVLLFALMSMAAKRYPAEDNARITVDRESIAVHPRAILALVLTLGHASSSPLPRGRSSGSELASIGVHKKSRHKAGIFVAGRDPADSIPFQAVASTTFANFFLS